MFAGFLFLFLPVAEMKLLQISSSDETKPTDSSKVDSSNAEMPPPVEKVEVYVRKPEAPKPKPNPNGVYLPTGDPEREW